MSHDNTLTKVEKSADKMYGDRNLLVCGYTEAEQKAMLLLLQKNKLGSCPVIFATNEDIQKPLKEILQAENRYGHGEASEMRKAVIMSGFTQKQLHALMAAHRKSKLPRQHWAALTPTSENWALTELLEELEAEAEAIRTQKSKP